MDTQDIVEEIAACIEFELERLPELDLAAIGPICDELGSGLRTLAGCALLLEADSDAWRRHLIRSGRIRLNYLARWRREQPDTPNPYAAAGNGSAWFDAIAAGDLALARDIDRATPTTFWIGEEYEEDHCAVALVRQFVAGPPEPAPLATAVHRLRQTRDGAPSALADACEAIGRRDATAFEAAFHALLAERAAELDSLGEPYTPYDEAAHRVATSFYVEGIAVLNLASAHGVPTAREYRFCPAITRVGLDGRMQPA